MSNQPISRSSVSGIISRWRVWFAVAAAGVLLASCDARRGLQITAEVDEPHFRRAQQMLRSGQKDVALEAFLKVIDKRGGDAPESHLEAGQLYLNQMRDPWAAIYHFRRYLQLRPNSPQAPNVNQLIDTAKKECVRGLPGNLLGAESDRLDLHDVIERQKAEIDGLRAELQRLGRTPTTAQAIPSFGQSTPNQRPAAPQPQSPARAAAPTPVAERPQAAPQQSWPATIPDDGTVQPAEPIDVPAAPALAGTTRNQPPTRPSASGRSYTVQKGEGLYAIATKVYGRGNRWKEILEANRDQLTSETALKPGMVLRIP